MSDLSRLIGASRELSDAYQNFVQVNLAQPIDWQHRYESLKNLISQRIDQEKDCIQAAKEGKLPLSIIESESMHVAYSSLMLYIEQVIEQDIVEE